VNIIPYLIDEDSNVPKHIQIADSIIESISSGRIKVGRRLPSINEICQEWSLAKDTVQKAFKILKDKKIVISVRGKGYFTARTDLISKINILFMINKPSSYKMQVFNSFLKRIEGVASVKLSVYHCEEELFVTTLENNLGVYDYYVIMPHFRNKEFKYVKQTKAVLDVIQKIPKDKLLFLDNQLTGISGEYGSVIQDFEKDIQQALVEGLEKLSKYEKIIFIFPQKSAYPYPDEIIDGFQNFCIEHSFNFEILDEVDDDMEVQPLDVYIVIEENELVKLVKQVKNRNFILGRDIGIISYNDTALKELLDITVVSTDFRLMGETAVDMLLNKKENQIKNKFQFLDRKSV